jgi:hypothetical protein
MQKLNYDTSISLQNHTKLGAKYDALLTRRDGEQIAVEITNRLANYADAEIKQMHCDIRKWMNQEFKAYGRVGFGGKAITGEILPTDKYKLIVQYKATGVRNEKHFWNLFIKAQVPGGGLEFAQIAHFTIYSEVIRPIRGKKDYTILGAFHLKDNLALGSLDATKKAIDTTKPHEHAAGLISATGKGTAEIVQSFRRYFIRTVSVPGTSAVGTTPAVPPKTHYEIGFQEQKGNVSSAANQFARVVVTVLQEYFDAGFSVAGFKTPVVPNYFKAKDYCKAVPKYVEANDIGKTTDIPEPTGASAKATARANAIASGLNISKPDNLKKIAAKENAAEKAARLAALRAFPIIGGKTRRAKRNRRLTRRK